MLITQLCLTDSIVHGILQQEHWNGVLFISPGDIPGPGIEPGSPEPQGKPLQGGCPSSEARPFLKLPRAALLRATPHPQHQCPRELLERTHLGPTPEVQAWGSWSCFRKTSRWFWWMGRQQWTNEDLDLLFLTETHLYFFKTHSHHTTFHATKRKALETIEQQCNSMYVRVRESSQTFTTPVLGMGLQPWPLCSALIGGFVSLIGWPQVIPTFCQPFALSRCSVMALPPPMWLEYT